MKTMFQFFVLVIVIMIIPATSFSQWEQLNGQFTADIQCFAASTNPADTTKTYIFAGTWGNGIFRSTDDGQSWAQIDSGLTNLFINKLAVIGSDLYAGTENGLFLSKNNGAIWFEIDSGLSNKTVYSIIKTPSATDSLKTNLFAGTWGDGIFLSQNDGTSWTQVDSGLTDWNIYSIVTTPSTFGAGTPNIFAGSYGGGIFLSTNNGTSWTAVNKGITCRTITDLVTCPVVGGTGGINIYAIAYGFGLFFSTNNGKNWASMIVGSGTSDCTSFIVNSSIGGTNFFVGSWGDGVLMSTNYGKQWNDVNSGLSNTRVLSLCVSGKYLFAGTTGHGIWRRPLSDMNTGIQNTQNTSPHCFKLNQNYPNPFNPTTTISFSLPSRSFVSLKVFDALGREVSTLVSEELPTGNYSRVWNAEKLSSGVYFYRLSASPIAKRGESAGSFTETKKLILQK